MTAPRRFDAIVRAVLNPQRRQPLTGTVHTPAGSWHGELTDRGSAICVWDNERKTATWIDPDAITAITQDPYSQDPGATA